MSNENIKLERREYVSGCLDISHWDDVVDYIQQQNGDVRGVLISSGKASLDLTFTESQWKVLESKITQGYERL